MSLISQPSVPLFTLADHQSLPADNPSVSKARSGKTAHRSLVGRLLFVGVGSLHLLSAGVSDLGYFDQAVYLISRGKPPFIPTLGFPILADHGAYMLYPVALLYVIYPSVLWLFATQAVALAGSAWFVSHWRDRRA